MPLSFPLRRALANAHQPGAWLTLPSTPVAYTLASTPGLDWVCIDGEHGLISDPHYFDLCNAVAAKGVSPMIRVPSDEIWLLKRALDAGAHAIMVPQINTAAAARRVVQGCKYGPPNLRGFGPMYTHAAGGIGMAYKKEANEQVVICVQIESPEAISNIEAICKEDIDCAFIGPFDLSVAMGVDFGSKEHEGAIQDILAAAHKAGKKAGIFCSNGAASAKRMAEGFDMVSVCTDIDSLAAQTAKEVEVALKTSVAQQGGYAI